MTSLQNLKASRAFAAAFTAFILLLASTSNATIQISGANGVSRADAVTPNMSQFRIYAGLAGLSTSSCSGTGTCDTCAGKTLDNNFAGCNNKAVTNATRVVINFTSSSVSGFPIAFNSNGTTTTNGTTTGETAINVDNPTGNALAAGSLATVTIPWSAICNIGGNQDCSQLTAGQTITFSVGISTTSAVMTGTESFPVTAIVSPSIDPYYYADDKNCTGSTANFCYFEAYPGDSKITVQNVSSVGSPGASFSGLRFYFEEASVQTSTEAVPLTDFGNITLDSPSADLQLDPAGTGGFVGNGRVTGLDNDKIYVFKMAHLDLANNLGLVTSDYANGQGPPSVGATPVGTPSYVADTNCDTGAISGSNVGTATCHVAEPGAVEGILAKEVNCFIATAAYGSPFQAKVQTFRDFRNRYLLNNALGKKFVHFYYAGFGPHAAEFIRHSETLRAMSRTALFPMWLFAKLSMELGLFGALLVSFGFFGLLVATARVCSQHLRMDA